MKKVFSLIFLLLSIVTFSYSMENCDNRDAPWNTPKEHDEDKPIKKPKSFIKKVLTGTGRFLSTLISFDEVYPPYSIYPKPYATSAYRRIDFRKNSDGSSME